MEAVIIYTWSRVLHMRNRAAFYLLMSSCMLVVVLTRGDAGTGMRFAYLVFTGGVLPFLMADERPARKVFVIALMNVAIMIAEVLGTALWYGMRESTSSIRQYCGRISESSRSCTRSISS